MISYEIDSKRGLLFERFSGRTTVSDVGEHIIRYTNDSNFSPNYPSIVIIESDNEIHLPTDYEINFLRKIFNELGKVRSGVRVAAVCEDSVTLELVKFSLSFIAQEGFEFRAFVDQEQAISWANAK